MLPNCRRTLLTWLSNITKLSIASHNNKHVNEEPVFSCQIDDFIYICVCVCDTFLMFFDETHKTSTKLFRVYILFRRYMLICNVYSKIKAELCTYPCFTSSYMEC